jgi:hypothetical protein
MQPHRVLCTALDFVHKTRALGPPHVARIGAANNLLYSPSNSTVLRCVLCIHLALARTLPVALAAFHHEVLMSEAPRLGLRSRLRRPFRIMRLAPAPHPLEDLRAAVVGS